MTTPSYQELLEECVAFHGHLCLGQPLGVRLAVAGLNYLGLPIKPVPERRYRDLIVILENDRCIADAIAVVSGARLGRKTLKLQRYGKSAATFCLLDANNNNSAADKPSETVKIDKAVRVSVSETLGDHIATFARKQGLDPGAKDTSIRAVLSLPPEDFLQLIPVKLELPRFELPGRPQRHVTCESCGERVLDGKDVEKSGKFFCRACASGAYYTMLV